MLEGLKVLESTEPQNVCGAGRSSGWGIWVGKSFKGHLTPLQ